MLELLYSAHIACGGLLMTKFLYCQAVPGGGRVSCVLVMMSFEVVVPVGVSLDV